MIEEYRGYQHGDVKVKVTASVVDKLTAEKHYTSYSSTIVVATFYDFLEAVVDWHGSLLKTASSPTKHSRDYAVAHANPRMKRKCQRGMALSKTSTHAY